MTIELLYFEGCPHYERTLVLVREVLGEEGLPPVVHEIEVRDEPAARHHRFLGSPSVRVNGLDVDPGVRDREDFAFGCRIYGTSGVPSRGLIRAAIREARG